MTSYPRVCFAYEALGLPNTFILLISRPERLLVFEWQGRGSSHAVCIGLTLEGSPSAEMTEPAEREEFARVWGYHVSAINPEPDQIGCGGDGSSPCN